MKLNYLRGFPNEIKIINDATSKIISSLKKSQVPLTPENIKQIFDSEKKKKGELIIAVENYEKRLGKEDELLEIKRMARETILSLFHLLQLENIEELEDLLKEIDRAKETMTILSLFGTAAFFIAEFSKSSQLKDASSETKSMTTNVKGILDGNKESIRSGIDNKTIDEKTGHQILSNITKSTATMEEHSMLMEDVIRLKDGELSELLTRMQKTETMFDQLKKHHIQMIKKMDVMAQESRTDILTGLLNRKGFNEALEGEISKCKRFNSALSLAMTHMDNLSSIGDELGAPIKDKLLVAVANLVKKVTRKCDISSRVGGETIFTLFPNSALKDSIKAVKKLQKNLEETDFTVRGNSIQVNVSIGLNECGPEDTAETIVESVDSLLLKAKADEKNTICYPDMKEIE